MNPYDSLAYDSLCIPETHPERLAVLARIMGFPAADPRAVGWSTWARRAAAT